MGGPRGLKQQEHVEHLAKGIQPININNSYSNNAEQQQQQQQLHLPLCNGKINKYSCWKFTCKHANCKAAANEGYVWPSRTLARHGVEEWIVFSVFVSAVSSAGQSRAPKMWQFRVNR